MVGMEPQAMPSWTVAWGLARSGMAAVVGRLMELERLRALVAVETLPDPVAARERALLMTAQAAAAGPGEWGPPLLGPRARMVGLLSRRLYLALAFLTAAAGLVVEV